MFGVCQQILGAERNTLQGAAQALALNVPVDLFRFMQNVLAQQERECVVAWPDGLQTIAESARQLNGGEFLLRELLVDFGDAGEEDVVWDGGHGVAQGLKIVAGSAAIGKGNLSS